MCSPRNSASRESQEMESFYLIVGIQVMDSRGVEGDSGRREGDFKKNRNQKNRNSSQRKDRRQQEAANKV